MVGIEISDPSGGLRCQGDRTSPGCDVGGAGQLRCLDGSRCFGCRLQAAHTIGRHLRGVRRGHARRRPLARSVTGPRLGQHCQLLGDRGEVKSPKLASSTSYSLVGRCALTTSSLASPSAHITSTSLWPRSSSLPGSALPSRCWAWRSVDGPGRRSGDEANWSVALSSSSSGWPSESVCHREYGSYPA